jgi:branched-chain amino acid transport system substrate-binding protein
MPTNLTRRQALAIPAGLALGSPLAVPPLLPSPSKSVWLRRYRDSPPNRARITRGLTIAIDEINAKGGVLGGRMLELVRRDDESNPAKGQTAARELIDKEGCAILFGGIDSPVSQAIVPLVNQAQVPFMGVWAAATNITRNGANPNYVFRVSAVDVLVDRALIKHAMTSFGSKTPGLMLVNNGWGESNLGGLIAAAGAAGIKLAGAEKFEDKDVDMTATAAAARCRCGCGDPGR